MTKSSVTNAGQQAIGARLVPLSDNAQSSPGPYRDNGSHMLSSCPSPFLPLTLTTKTVRVLGKLPSNQQSPGQMVSFAAGEANGLM